MKAKSKRAYGIRYDDVFLMACLLLKLKSPRAYRHIQKEGLLPLPSVNTIRTMLSSSECKFGFNDLALKTMKTALQGAPFSSTWGQLIFDEIKIKKDLTFDKGTLEHHGIVDFGKNLKTKISKGLADHVLVFMFRPYKCKWVQPFACFASKGAASGSILFELITKAIVILHNHGAIVKGVVSDGAQPNKSAYRMFGIDGRRKSDRQCHKFYINHPQDSKTKIFFFVDVPHLLKCVRNHILTHKYVQVQSFFRQKIFKKVLVQRVIIT